MIDGGSGLGNTPSSTTIQASTTAESTKPSTTLATTPATTQRQTTQRRTIVMPTTSRCPSTHFECRSSRRCIRRDWLCDGVGDCPDRSDEVDCSGNETFVHDTTCCTRLYIIRHMKTTAKAENNLKKVRTLAKNLSKYTPVKSYEVPQLRQ